MVRTVYVVRDVFGTGDVYVCGTRELAERVEKDCVCYEAGGTSVDEVQLWESAEDWLRAKEAGA